MEHLGTCRLSFRGICLRRFALSDAEAMFYNWASDPEVTKFLTWQPHKNVAVTREILSDWIGHYSEPDFYQWAICFEDSPENPIGCISVVDKNDPTEAVEIGYALSRQHWHQGITSCALAMVIRFFFEQVGLNRICAKHDPRNPNSGRVMLHCGMQLEGTLRQATTSNMGICDISVYSILRSEYQQRKKTAEAGKG